MYDDVIQTIHISDKFDLLCGKDKADAIDKVRVKMYLTKPLSH